jgi:MYXO-CTERM domain-containing protein
VRTTLVLTLFAAALALASVAQAKGPDYALISGPGISGSLRIDGDGEGAAQTPLGALVTYGGYASQVFGHHPKDPTLRARPAGTLGPRYLVVYSVPTPTGRRSIEADLYPFATPRPLTHMRPGQQFFGLIRTHGGWYIAKPGLRRTLIDAGLLTSGPSDRTTAWRWIGVSAGALLALLAIAAALLLRRRPQSTTAAAA